MLRSPLASSIVVLGMIGCAAANEGAMSRAERAVRTSSAPSRPPAKSRHFELHYEATVTSAPAGSTEVDLWLPVAHDTDFQRVTLTAATAPQGHEVNVEPMLGNKIFHVRVPASSLPLTVRLDYDVVRDERKTDLSAARNRTILMPSDRDRYLTGTTLVPVGDSVATMSGFHANGADSVAVARQAYDHVLGKMRYDKPANSGWGRGSTEWACKEGFGNCTDFHAYFMSLTRTNGVPSRFLMGMPLPSDKTEGEIGGYHCWAEFFVDGRGWIPVDISEADKVADQQPDMVEFYFGGLTVDRVEFTAGRDVKLVPAQKGAALNFFIYPYCEIDGVEAPKGAIARKFTFKNL